MSVQCLGESVSSDNMLASSKVRKPYTITKQRERWSEEEHLKFLEALRLYGRAWRRIEEHIGTKTAVQIRSHAQKFFSKLVKGTTSRGTSADKVEDIEIPPPRPKKKPRHPYPRKAASLSASPIGSQVTKDVTSLLSVVSSAPLLVDNPEKRTGFVPYKPTPPLPSHSNEMKMESPNTSCNTSGNSLLSLKLFGRTMLVPTLDSSCDSLSPESIFHDNNGAFRKVAPLNREKCFAKEDENEDKSVDDGNDSSDSGSQETIVPTDLALNSIVSSNFKQSKQEEDEDAAASGESSPSYPRHVPVQCVVDGTHTQIVQDVDKDWLHMSCASSSHSPTNQFNNNPDSKPDAVTSWQNVLSAVFPWGQMQQSDPSIAEAVAAATAAAASAWWSLYGVNPPLYHPTVLSQAEASKNLNANEGKLETEQPRSNPNDTGEIKTEQEQLPPDEREDCRMREDERSSDGSNSASSSEVAVDSFMANNTVSKSIGSLKRSRDGSEGCAIDGSDLEEENSTSKRNSKFNNLIRESSDVGSNNCSESFVYSENNQQQDESRPLPVKVVTESLCQSNFVEDALSNMHAFDRTQENYGNSVSSVFSKLNARTDKQQNSNDQMSKHKAESQLVTTVKPLDERGTNTIKRSLKLPSIIARSKPGSGFVPYERCSTQAFRNSVNSQSEMKCQDGLVDANRVCSKQ